MKLIIEGKLSNAPDCVTAIAVVGPYSYSHQEVKKGSFIISLDVSHVGLYSVYAHGLTSGILQFNITGDVGKITPKVPAKLSSSFSVPFNVQVIERSALSI